MFSCWFWEVFSGTEALPSKINLHVFCLDDSGLHYLNGKETGSRFKITLKTLRMLMQKAVYNKNDLRNFVKEVISGKVKSLEFYLNFTLEASRDIKKTTKYDSIREEIQSEIYHLDKQMFSLKNMQRQMQKVLNSSSETVKLGSVVITNKARFYISVSMGEFFYEGDRFYAISEESPMAKTMKGKKVGDEFTLNNIHQKIEEVY